MQITQEQLKKDAFSIFQVESLKKSGPGIMRNGISDEDIQRKSAQANTSALALLKPPHLKWMALTGFLMFSVFSL